MMSEMLPVGKYMAYISVNFISFSLFLYFGFSLRPYQETALGLPVVVRVPQFDKS